MSPEQVRGEMVDHRSDIFSFGCLVYEMLSGKRAFQGTSSIDTLHAILHSEPRDPSTLAAVPDALIRIVGRCLEKAPEARFQTASDLVFALGAVAATPTGSPRALPRYVPAVIAVGLKALLAISMRSTPCATRGSSTFNSLTCSSRRCQRRKVRFCGPVRTANSTFRPRIAARSAADFAAYSRTKS